MFEFEQFGESLESLRVSEDNKQIRDLDSPVTSEESTLSSLWNKNSTMSHSGSPKFTSVDFGLSNSVVNEEASFFNVKPGVVFEELEKSPVDCIDNAFSGLGFSPKFESKTSINAKNISSQMNVKLDEV